MIHCLNLLRTFQICISLFQNRCISYFWKRRKPPRINAHFSRSTAPNRLTAVSHGPTTWFHATWLNIWVHSSIAENVWKKKRPENIVVRPSAISMKTVRHYLRWYYRGRKLVLEILGNAFVSHIKSVCIDHCKGQLTARWSQAMSNVRSPHIQMASVQAFITTVYLSFRFFRPQFDVLLRFESLGCFLSHWLLRQSSSPLCNF